MRPRLVPYLLIAGTSRKATTVHYALRTPIPAWSVISRWSDTEFRLPEFRQLLAEPLKRGAPRDRAATAPPLNDNPYYFTSKWDALSSTGFLWASSDCRFCGDRLGAARARDQQSGHSILYFSLSPFLLARERCGEVRPPLWSWLRWKPGFSR